MKVFFKNILLIACILSIVTISLTQARGTFNKVEWGTRPATFCIPKEQSAWNCTYNIKSTSFLFWKWNYYDAASSNLYIYGQEITQNYIMLTRSTNDEYPQAGHVYHYQQMNFENGFEMKFNMRIQNDKCRYQEIKKCYMSIFGYCLWSLPSEFIKLNCGGKGFAAVLHAGGFNLGQSGAGLGYQGLQNVFAIEFDTSTDISLNDPSNGIERHISIIINKGSAQANEANAMAWNDYPTTFFKPNQEGSANYINAQYKIQYYNQMLRVYINDVLELAVYTKFNIASQLGLNSHAELIAGVTASTASDVANDHILTNFQIQIARPQLSKFTTQIRQPIRQVLQYLELAISLYDSCGQLYYPLNYEQYDSPSMFALLRDSTSGDCTQIDVKQDGWQIVIGFRCTVSGQKTINFRYNNIQSSSPVSFFVNPNSPVRIVLLPLYSVGKIGAIYEFKIRAFDSLGNFAETNPIALRDLITIEWPIPSQTKIIHSVRLDTTTTGVWIVSFEPDTTGVYTIKSRLMDNSQQFTVQIGDPFDQTSFSRVVLSTRVFPSITNVMTPLEIGTKTQVIVELYDKSNNRVNASTYTNSYTLRVYNGFDQIVASVAQSNFNTTQQLNYLFFDVPDDFQRTNTFYRLFVSRNSPAAQLNCTVCTLSLRTGPLVFDNTRVLQWNWHLQDHQFFCAQTLNYGVDKGIGCDRSNPTTTGLYYFKGDKFQYYLQFYDRLYNVLDKFSMDGYAAKLSGNNMRELNLNFTPYEGMVGTYGYGALLQIQPADLPTFNRLVGLCDYRLTFFNKTNPTQQITWLVDIFSDGQDSDAGNGDFDISQTKVVWNDGSSTLYGVAGEKQSLIITLANSRGERYNSWLDNNGNPIAVSVKFENGEYTQTNANNNDYCTAAQQYLKPGQYRVDCYFYKTNNKQRLSIVTINNGTANVNAAKRVGLYLRSGSSIKAMIDSQNIINQTGTVLPDAISSYDYNFFVNVFDKYDNIAIATYDIGQISFEYQAQDYQSTAPWYCTLIDWMFTDYCKQQTKTTIIMVTKSFSGRQALAKPGVYSIIMNSPIIGQITVRNQFFASAYTLQAVVATPDASKSNSTIDNYASTFKAGSSISFRIVPMDVMGNTYKSEQFKTDYLNNFALTISFNGQKQNVNITQRIDTTIVTLKMINTFSPTVAGTYIFQPTYKGIALQCQYCTAEVVAADVDYTKSVLTRVDSLQTVVSKTGPTVFDVNKNSPAFILSFYDVYLNKVKIPSALITASMKGVLNIQYSTAKTTGSTNSYDFTAATVSDSQIRFQFDETKSKTIGSDTKTQIDFYRQEAGIDNCNLVLTLATGNTLTYNGINLINSQSPYDNSAPRTITPVPSTITFAAGTIQTVKLEIRTQNNTLWFGESLGWFSDIKSSISVVGLTNYTLTRGSQRSTYMLTFNETTAVTNKQITVSFVYNSATFNGTTPLSITVQPLNVFQLSLVDQANDFKDCVSGQSRTVRFLAQDIFNNNVVSYRTGEDGLQFLPDLQQNPSFLFDSVTSQVRVVLNCTKAGTINVSANRAFKNAASVSMNILTGSISAVQSKQKLSTQQIIAGKQLVTVFIYPFDANGNAITIDSTRYPAASNQNLISAFIYFSGNNGTQSLGIPSLSADNKYFFYTINMTKSGTHTIISQFNGVTIFADVNRVQVIADEAKWDNSTLAIYRQETLKFELMNPFTQNQKQYPQFQVLPFDVHGNPAVLPDAWKSNLEMYIDGVGFTYATRFPLVQTQTDFSIFQLISNEVFNQTNGTSALTGYTKNKSPLDRWTDEDMQNNQTYNLNFILSASGNKFNKLYSLLVQGPQQDPELSNLPMNVSNTVLIPNDYLRCRAGESTFFTIETRTTNPSLVTIGWDLVTTSNSQINLLFSQDAQGANTYNYTIIRGDRRGRYLVTINCMRAYSEIAPNQITVNIMGQNFTKFNLQMIVTPAKINNVIPADIALNQRVLSARRADEFHAEYFLARDQFNNSIQLTQDKGLNLEISIDNKSIAYDKTYTLTGLLQTQFQPQINGNLQYDFGLSGAHKISILPGLFSSAQSFVTQDSTNIVVAGNTAQLIINPRDVWGNSLSYTTTDAQNQLLKSNSFSYSYLEPGSSTGYVQGNANFTFDSSNKLVLNLILTIKGQYLFKVFANGQPLRMTQSSRTVVPDTAVLTKSIVQYFDHSNNAMNKLDQTKALNEDNFNEVPQYSLILADKYSNTYDSFTWNKTQFSIKLQEDLSHPQNDFGTKRYIDFTPGDIVGNAMYFSVADADKTQYKQIAESLNAQLIIKYNVDNQVVQYIINLKGQKGDSDVSYGTINTTLSTVTPYVAFVAGDTATVNVEIKVNQGFRKADADASKITFSFASLSNGTTATSYQLRQCFQAEGRGSFICYITGTQAVYNKNYIVATVSYDGQAITQKCNLDVSPNKFSFISIVSGNKQTVTADQTAEFRFRAYDQYKNELRNVLANQINVQIQDITQITQSTSQPSSQTDQSTKSVIVSQVIQPAYKSFVDSDGLIVYQIQARTAKQYSIISPQIDLSQSAFNFYTVQPGAISNINSILSLSTNSITVGDQLIVSVTPYDSYGNLISNKDTAAYDAVDIQYQSLILNNQNNIQMNGTLDLVGNNFQQSYTQTYNGDVLVVVEIDGKSMNCKNCIVTFNQGPIDITKTKFRIPTYSGIATDLERLQITYGDSSFKITATLFDQYNNQINNIPSNSVFTGDLSGHFMDVVPLNISLILQNTKLLITPAKQADELQIQRLVVRNNYNISLSYSGKTVILPFDVLGNATLTQDAGNGQLVLTNTYLSQSSLILVAGIPSIVILELRNVENLRLNQFFNGTQFLSVVEGGIINNDSLRLIMTEGDKYGKYVFNVTGYKSTKGFTKELIFSINGTQIKQRVKVQVDPDIPDFSRTEYVYGDNSTNISPVNPQGKARFRLYDKYNNQYADNKFSQFLSAQFLQGMVLTNNSINLDSNDTFVYTFVPKYPPKTVQLGFMFKKNVDNGTATAQYIKNEYFYYTIDQVLDWNLTVVTGVDLVGKQVDEDISFLVTSKDQGNYCFENSVDFTVEVIGPYRNNYTDDAEQMDSQTLISVRSNNTSVYIQQQGDSCLGQYKAVISKNTLTRLGYYQINLINNKKDSQGKDYRIISLRKTQMSAGAINLDKTLLVAPSLYNRGNAPLQVSVQQQLTVFAVLRDSFNNKVVKETKHAVTLEVDKWVLNKDYVYNVTNLQNGTYKIDFVSFKTGMLVGLSLGITDENKNFRKFPTAVLDKQDVPDNITVIPGPCDSNSTIVSLANLQNKTGNVTQNLSIGNLYTFDIQCRDQFGNNLQQGGSQFLVQLSGYNLKQVQSQKMNVKVTDLNNGIYRAEFILTWEGAYDVTVSLDSKFVPIANNTLFASVRCPQERPWLCVEGALKDQCVANSYIDCKYEELQTCPFNTPIKCNVNNVSTCVQHAQKCDCPANFIRCESDNKCVPSDKSYLCQTISTQSCNDTLFPVKCSNGQCRATLNDCPAQPVCPPKFTLCPDSTCVQSSIGCDFNKFDNCSDTKPFRCHDQSCASTPAECPTRVSCSKFNQVLCPDNSCADNVLQCQIPNQCQSGVLCPDQSCRPSFSMCPKQISCQPGYSLCLSGNCQISCLEETVVVSTNRFVRLLGNSRALQTSNTSVVVTPSSSCSQYRCPGGECAQTQYQCPSKVTCPVGSVICPDLSCVSTASQCVKNVCKTGEFHCHDGKCVDNINKCSTRPICPDEFPILCINNKCVKDVSECQAITSCPKNLPYRCGAGDCRASATDCPTLITCPPERPLKCTDNSCVTQKDDCVKVVKAQSCSTEFPYQCSDGSCAKSLILCPTQQSCPNNFVRCWNNECVGGISQCPSLEKDVNICQSNTPYRCPDGSCASAPSNCPTQIICPIERPILCDDGTCKQSNSQCYTKTSCSTGKRRCPDGSCVSILSACGTPVTCSYSLPYKCYDNTCRANPQDCPAVPTCNELAPILCPDGTCVSIRDNCANIFAKCDTAKPVRCEDRQCYKERSECPVIQGCPQGLYRCEDGSCLPNSQSCPVVSCPAHLSYKCPDGFCVSNKELCDQSNGCPYDKQFKCSNGQCVVNSTMCNSTLQVNSSQICDKNQFLCPDGSCTLDKSQCYNANGCPQETPLKCASGECINPNKTSCNIANCPASAPIKCLDGLCVKSSSYCMISLPDTVNYCLKDANAIAQGNVVPCADGRCVATSDQCRPIYQCTNNQYRCGDGSCRPSESMCPKVNVTCPTDRPFRCQIGACAINVNACPTADGCTNEFPQRCSKNGQCARTEADCQSNYANVTLPNGCLVDTPIRCSTTKKCIAIGQTCPKANKCPAETPFLCELNKQCVASSEQCKQVKTECLANEVQCPDNSCSTSYAQCTIENGCTVSKPYLGSDGECYAVPFTGHGEKGPQLSFSCPDFQPYMCSSGECVGDQNHCRTQLPCPADKPNRCPDQTCKANLSQCTALTICPKTLPILCENGQCASSVSQCQIAKNMFCTAERPFQCVTGVCVEQPNLCVPQNVRDGSADYFKKVSENSTIFFDPGCSVDLPSRCQDGSCRKYYYNCPVFSGCPQVGQSYRCKSGRCAANATECAKYDKSLVPCANNMTRNHDGYCRLRNVTVFGCPTNKPLMCPSGYCARSQAECAGESSCKSLSKPFRCADGSCVQSLSMCARPLRTYQPELIQITIGSTETKQFYFIKSDTSNQQFGSITSVAGTLLDKLTNNTDVIKKRMLQAANNTQEELKALMIRPVQDSDLIDYNVQILESRYQYVNDFFPTSEGTLLFHQAVRSPIVQLSSEGQRNTSEEYRFPIILTLQADILQGSNKTTDYCLGKQDTKSKQFVCSSRQLSKIDDISSNKFGYPVLQDGVYAVIFNPQEPEEQVRGEYCGFYCQNKAAVLGGIFGGLFGIIIICYVFWRMTRYVTKYRLMKKKQQNLNKQIYDLNQQSTNIVGQSLGDKAQGIVFVKNDAYQRQETQENSEELIHMQSMLEKAKKKEKQLEQANNELNERNKTLLTQIEILRSDTYKKGINQSDAQFELGNMGQKEF